MNDFFQFEQIDSCFPSSSVSISILSVILRMFENQMNLQNTMMSFHIPLTLLLLLVTVMNESNHYYHYTIHNSTHKHYCHRQQTTMSNWKASTMEQYHSHPRRIWHHWHNTQTKIHAQNAPWPNGQNRHHHRWKLHLAWSRHIPPIHKIYAWTITCLRWESGG